MSKWKFQRIAAVGLLGGVLSSATYTAVTAYQTMPGVVYAAVGQAVHQPHDHVGLHRLPERGRRPTTDVTSAGSASPVMVPPW